MSGYIQKRGNSFQLVVFQGYDHNGKQKRYTKTVKNVSKTEAKLILADFALEVEKKGNPYINDKSLTFEDFITYWWNEYVIFNHTPRTQEWHKQIMARVVPALGHLKIKDIQPMHLIGFYNELRKTNLSNRTIQMHHKFISSVLGKAEKWQFLKHNPCHNVEAPRAKSTKIAIFDENELKHFLSLLDEEPLKYKVFCVLLLSTGLRRGEALGLTWDKINFSNKTITVSQTVQYTNKQMIVTQPKTDSSNRTIAVSENILALLLKYKSEQDEEKTLLMSKNIADFHDYGFIFTQNNGRPMFPSTAYSWLQKMLQKNGLPPISIHSFRHMSATFLLASGANIKSVSARLGHSKVSTTTDTYAHALQSVDRDNAERLDDFINKK